jgi:hypothetical protein
MVTRTKLLNSTMIIWINMLDSTMTTIIKRSKLQTTSPIAFLPFYLEQRSEKDHGGSITTLFDVD